MLRNMRHLVAVMAMVAVTAGLWANGNSESKQVPSKDQPVELVYWSHYGQSPAFVQAFADSVNIAAKKLGYTNVTCRAEVIEFSNYEAKYITGFASGNGPDFFLGKPEDWAIDGGKNPVAIALDDKAAKEWDDSLAALYKPHGVYNGKRYGFPAEGGSLQMIYVNTDAMKEIGLDPENDYPRTLDEMKDMAIKLTKRDTSGKIVRSGFQPRYLNGGANIWGKYSFYFHNFGCRVLSEDLNTAKGYINSEKSIAAAMWFQDLIKQTSNLEFGSPESSFQSGQTAMINREGWFAQDTQEKAPNIHFACIPFPAGEKDLGPGGSAWCNMISAKSKHIQLCQEIMAELAKPEYDITLHQPAGYPPVCKATMTMDNEYFKTMPYAKAFMVMATKEPGPAYDSIPQWSTISGMCGDTIAKIWNGADVKSNLDELAGQIDQVLEQSK
ncbi:MAG: extracellular solute-binding protein [Spirochaetaceae bacterium]|nr:extracellular solute-binding protein [Spirochaetaceae bacterium]